MASKKSKKQPPPVFDDVADPLVTGLTACKPSLGVFKEAGPKLLTRIALSALSIILTILIMA